MRHIFSNRKPLTIAQRVRRRVAYINRQLPFLPSFIINSTLQTIGMPPHPSIFYIVPQVNWSLHWDAHYITSHIQARFDCPIYLTHPHNLFAGHILHYGDVELYLAHLGNGYHDRNQLITTFFHGNLADVPDNLVRYTEQLLENTTQLTRIVTACGIMEKRLLRWGVPAEKVVRIPLGVDLSHFRPISPSQKQTLRHQLGIPQNAFCIGSFQKDGVGWEEGLTPKLIKGPDVFLDVLAKLHARHKNLFVLLTGPARGYIKRGLRKIGVPYRHDVLTNYHDVVRYYQCSDLYLVGSREEGGPKAVLEALATGVPLVATNVGMTPDVVEHGTNGFLADVEDVSQLATYVSQLIGDADLRHAVVQSGLETVQAYDWSHVADAYYTRLYQPLYEDSV